MSIFRELRHDARLSGEWHLRANVLRNVCQELAGALSERRRGRRGGPTTGQARQDNQTRQNQVGPSQAVQKMAMHKTLERASLSPTSTLETRLQKPRQVGTRAARARPCLGGQQMTRQQPATNLRGVPARSKVNRWLAREQTTRLGPGLEKAGRRRGADVKPMRRRSNPRPRPHGAQRQKLSVV